MQDQRTSEKSMVTPHLFVAEHFSCQGDPGFQIQNQERANITLQKQCKTPPHLLNKEGSSEGPNNISYLLVFAIKTLERK